MSGRGSFEWTERKARWYMRAVRYNNYPLELLKVIFPLLKDCSSVLDVGAGCGAFAFPLARVLPSVTALEPAPPMAALMRSEAARLKLPNVDIVEADFRKADIAPHDAVLCAFVKEAAEDLEGFLGWVERVAKRRVILVRTARRDEDKLFLRELQELLFGTSRPGPTDYMNTLSRLHGLGIFANVRTVEFSLDQPFDDLDEAVAFWREYLGVDDSSHDEALGAFLQERLAATGGGLVAPVRHTSAVLWWERS